VPQESEFEPRWSDREPEFAAAANSVSVLLNHIEPLLAATVRRACSDLDDRLAAEAQRFVAEERSHAQVHRRANRALIDTYPSLARVDRMSARTYRWISRRALGDQLAFAAASEAIAYAIARWTARHTSRLFAGAHPGTAALFRWHLDEEVAHKSVAFDVHVAITGGRRGYARALVVSFGLLALFSTWGTLVILAADRRLSRPGTWTRLAGLAFSFFFDAAPDLLASCTRGHHPSQLVDPTPYRGSPDAPLTPVPAAATPLPAPTAAGPPPAPVLEGSSSERSWPGS
jgi:predicted metal-dependent hydrolase